MKVLVMGGTMFNGLALVHELVRHGHSVTLLNRGKTEADLPRGIARLIADRTDPKRMRETLGGLEFDAIFDVSAYRLQDVELMAELFRGRTGHYVFISSTVIYAASDLLPITEDMPVDRSERQNDYGTQKLLCEDFLIRQHREHGFPATVVALSMVFGPRNILPDREQRMFARLVQGRPIMIPGDGSTIAQVGHVEDQASALRHVMGQPATFGKRYNLTGGDAFTATGYVDLFAEVTGRPASTIFIPPDHMDRLFDGEISLRGDAPQLNIDRSKAPAASHVGTQPFLLSMLVQRIAPNIHRWNRNVTFGVERLRKDVGWEPKIRFPTAVEDTWRWFHDSGLSKTREFDWRFEDAILSGLP